MEDRIQLNQQYNDLHGVKKLEEEFFKIKNSVVIDKMVNVLWSEVSW